MASSGVSVPFWTISSRVSVRHMPIVDLLYNSNVAIGHLTANKIRKEEYLNLNQTKKLRYEAKILWNWERERENKMKGTGRGDVKSDRCCDDGGGNWESGTERLLWRIFWAERIWGFLYLAFVDAWIYSRDRFGTRIWMTTIPSQSVPDPDPIVHIKFKWMVRLHILIQLKR